MPEREAAGKPADGSIMTTPEGAPRDGSSSSSEPRCNIAQPSGREFHQLAESISHLAWMANADGWIFWYNRRWYEYTGTTPEQMEGWGWQSVHLPEELPNVIKAWETAIRTGEPFEMTFPLRGADGVYRPFLTRATPLKDADGKVVRWFGTNTDISEQKQTEFAVKRSEAEARAREAELAAILDAVPAITFIAHDAECQNMTSNREAYDFLRLPYGSNTSRSAPAESRPDFRALSDGRELPPEELPVQRAAATGKKVVGAELTLLLKDGIKRDIFGNAVPVLDAAGNVRGAVGAFIDITERKRAEQEAYQLSQKLQALLTALPVGVSFSEDRTPLAITGNPAAQRQFEIRPEDNLSASALEENAPGRKIRFFHDGRQITDAELPLQRAIAENREIPPMELEVQMPGGRRWFTEASGAPVRDQNGDVVCGVAVTVDITERKNAERALMRAEKLATAGRLAATIAHEINNPLEAVTNILYLISSESDLDRIREYATVASMELSRVSHITRQTLGFYRDSTSPQSFKVSQLLEEAVALYKKEFSAAKVTCKTDYATPGEVHGFAGEMRQVFSNLIRNAVEAAPEGGFVSVSVRETRKAGKEGIGVFICDNGPGILPEHQGRIFEPFFTTKGQKGTGLGLWVAKDLVQKHGGYIRARSARVTARRGTCLYVFLPSGQKKPAASSTQGTAD